MGCGEVFILSSWDRERGTCGWKTTLLSSAGMFTVDVGFVLFCCQERCLVLLSPSLFTVQFLNRWRPASWWSWEEVEEGSCLEAEVECAAEKKKKRQNKHNLKWLDVPLKKPTNKRLKSAIKLAERSFIVKVVGWKHLWQLLLFYYHPASKNDFNETQKVIIEWTSINNCLLESSPFMMATPAKQHL